MITFNPTAANGWRNSPTPTGESVPTIARRTVSVVSGLRDPLDSRPGWLVDSERRLNSMENLQVGWDSYGGAMISRSVIAEVISWLRRIARIDTIPPSVVPLGSGGVQVEWHDRGINLEICVEAPGEFDVYYSAPGHDIIETVLEPEQAATLVPTRAS